MILQRVRRVLENWTQRGILDRLDRRKLQQELDLHRLFLLTTYHAQGPGGEQAAAQVSQAASSLTQEELRSSVAEHLRAQLHAIACSVHEALQEAGDAVLAATTVAQAQPPAALQPGRLPGKRSGLMMATGVDPPAAQQQPLRAQQAPDLPSAGPFGDQPAQRAADLLKLPLIMQRRLGFAVQVAPSGLEHPKAGNGLWLSGQAEPGAVVALYPGIVYPPLHYKHMPGYPRVDKGNDTLLARYDGSVVDALPWQQLAAPADGDLQVPGSKLPPWRRMLELRHPMAMGQYINHPPQGSQPNVMVASTDMQLQPGSEPHLRAYLPNAVFSPDLGPQPAQPVSVASGSPAALMGPEAQVLPGDLVPGIALVATRQLQNEELFLNYRLSPHVSRPAWYAPVDEEEEQRRWA